MSTSARRSARQAWALSVFALRVAAAVARGPRAGRLVALIAEHDPGRGEVEEPRHHPDFDALVVTGVTAPAHGQAVVNPDSSVTYTPQPGFEGTDGFDYVVSDGRPDGSALTPDNMPNSLVPSGSYEVVLCGQP